MKTALRKALDVIVTDPNHNHSFLVTDGGRENHNNEIEKFINELNNHKVTKVHALKDITFSNSPVEAIHRTMKGRYLKNKIFDSKESLLEYLKWAVDDYNIIRPHYKHAPKTPHEVYFNLTLGFDIKRRKRKAVQERVQNNKCSKCIECKRELKVAKVK